MKLKEIIAFMFDIKAAYSNWEWQRDQFHEESALMRNLEAAKLPKDAAYNLGVAMELMKQFDIELHKGLTYNDCRAVLPRANWRYDYGNPDRTFVYGQFINKPYKDVTEIQVIDGNVCFAIAKCALFARMAGVI